MDKVFIGLVAAALIMLAMITGPAFGWLCGWVVGAVFGNGILSVLGRFGVNVDGMTMEQLGMMLGFVGAFLKTSVSSSK